MWTSIRPTSSPPCSPPTTPSAPTSTLRYRTELSTLGRRVRVELPSGPALTGTATDVTVDGRLVVLDDGGATHRLAVADVVHLRTG